MAKSSTKRRPVRRNATRTRATTAPPNLGASTARGADLAALLGEHPDLLSVATASLATTLMADLAKARTPLAAEQIVSSAFGAMELDLPEDIGEAEAHETHAALMRMVIDWAISLASSEALALLRVASVIGPADSQAHATEAATSLARDGVADRPWAGVVGHPVLLQAWQYGDDFGSQASIGAQFDYRGREHVLMVLVDHDLGGGVKDAWVAEGRRAKGLREMIRGQMESDPFTFFEDIDAATLADLLGDALARPTCPMWPDQVEDVARHIHLVRSRAELVARLVEATALDGAGAELAGAEAGVEDVLQIKVALRHTKPPIWRRLEVPSGITLADLHAVLQVAFDWSGDHLHDFETVTKGRRHGETFEGPALSRIRLDSLAGGVGDRLIYRYDFGDDWVHDITVEARRPAEDGAARPVVCTAGRRAAPFEDTGGPYGHAMLLEALTGRDDPSREDLSDWIPDWVDPSACDPARFDRSCLNQALAKLA
ncbi:plasmid pRiA4b ORF-3 family protein [Intrasporangium sp.]|uniref:plasmid pRiA4b ORF-3 family protein n=1 Tax=Intrasporangium sp. TaxID=1925024 RepID=UPI003221F204